MYFYRYFAINNLNHMVAIAAMHYITWTYWHTPIQISLSMNVVAAYYMNVKCCEGKIDEAWVIQECIVGH